jgi:hypothetical protein
MRGGRTFRNTPRWTLLLVLLLAACNLDLKLSQPFLEIEARTGYNSPDEVMLRFKFSADEPVLRCRYAISKSGQEIAAGQTGPLAAGVWHDQTLDISAYGDGQYSFRLIVQAERSGELVDLAFLDKSVDFFLDTVPPADPQIDLTNGQRFTQQQSIQPSHPEWITPTVPQGSAVTIYYTTDGTDPRTSASRLPCTGSAIPLPFDRSIVSFKAVAEDGAGNQSGVKEISYYFTCITTIDPPGANNPATEQIKIYGFGFVGVTPSDIQMTDANSNQRALFFNTISESYIYIAADLKSAPIGAATISIRVSDRGPVTVTVPFQVN